MHHEPNVQRDAACSDGPVTLVFPKRPSSTSKSSSLVWSFTNASARPVAAIVYLPSDPDPAGRTAPTSLSEAWLTFKAGDDRRPAPTHATAAATPLSATKAPGGPATPRRPTRPDPPILRTVRHPFGSGEVGQAAGIDGHLEPRTGLPPDSDHEARLDRELPHRPRAITAPA